MADFAADDDPGQFRKTRRPDDGFGSPPASLPPLDLRPTLPQASPSQNVPSAEFNPFGHVDDGGQHEGQMDPDLAAVIAQQQLDQRLLALEESLFQDGSPAQADAEDRMVEQLAGQVASQVMARRSSGRAGEPHGRAA